MPAATASVPTNAPLDAFLSKVTTLIITPAITLLALAALVLFLWGVVEYIRNADNDEARKKGQSHIIWGIIGLVIMFGTTAIIAFLNGLLTAV